LSGHVQYISHFDQAEVVARSLGSAKENTMPARWRKLRVRDVATFVFVVAVVAIVGVVVGRELGVEREARAVLDAAGGEQLALPLIHI